MRVCFIRAHWSLIILQVPHCSYCSVIEGRFDLKKTDILMGGGKGVCQDAADCIKEDKNDFFVVRKGM